MKISGNQDLAAQSQSLLPVSLPKGTTALRGADSKVRDAHPAAAPDSPTFSQLLDAGDVERPAAPRMPSSQKASPGAGRKAALRDGARVPAKSGVDRSSAPSVGSVAASDRGVASTSPTPDGASRPSDASSAGPSASANDKAQADVGSSLSLASLNSDSAPLPPDPRLQQDPAELALEAAAIAAAQLLAAAAPAASVSELQSAGADSVSALSTDESAGNGQSSSPGSAFAAQLALRNIQSSLRAGGAGASATVQPSSVSGSQLQSPPASVVVPQALVPQVVSQVSLPQEARSLVPSAALPKAASSISAGSSVSFASPSMAGQEASVPLEAPLLSVSATAAQVSGLVSAARKNSPAGSQSAPLASGEASASLTASVPTLAQIQAQPLMPASLAPVQAGEQQQGAFFAPPAQSQGLGDPKEGPFADAQPAFATIQPRSESAVSGGLTSQDQGDAPSDGNSKGQNPSGQPAQHVENRKAATNQANLFDNSSPKVAPQSGTLGANESVVLSEAPTIRLSAEDNSVSQPAKVQEGGLASVSSSDSGSFMTGVSSAGHGTRMQLESVSKPVVLPVAHVKANEVWKVVNDALQRARSENPSHLAVEVRMDDGSTLGLEVRMSSTGLQASFRSESQTLLKTLEAQWNALVAKEPADAKVASAVFEGRTGFGSSTDSSSNGNERRQQLEDASAASSLARGSSPSKPSSNPAGTGTKQVTPSIRTRDGRVAVYA